MILEDFDSGFEWGLSHGGAALGSQDGANYARDVADEIKKFLATLDRRNIKTRSEIYQGNLQEFGLAGRFNINAIAEGSPYRAEVLESTDFASVDIRLYKVGINGTEVPGSSFNYSLKSYKDAAKSGRVQATTLKKAYLDYIKCHKNKGLTEESYSFQQFCLDRKLDPHSSKLTDLAYKGDLLLVAKGKYTGARKAIIGQIKKATAPEEIQSLKGALEMLDDGIETPDGDVRVLMWTRSDAERFTNMAKKGKLDLNKMGLNLDKIYTERRMLSSAVKSGKLAFCITLACKIAPLLAASISDFVNQGYLDFNDFSGETIKDSTESFLQGTISSYLSTKSSVELLKRGLGENVPPEAVAMIVALTLDIIVTTIKGYLNGLSQIQIAAHCMENSAIMLSAFAGMKIGASLGAKLGVAAFAPSGPLAIIPSLIGSFWGATVGSLTVAVFKKKCISLCINKGYTFFGLVEQDYTLPEELCDILHFDPIEVDSRPSDSVDDDSIRPDAFEGDCACSDSILDIILTRGKIDCDTIRFIINSD